MIRRNENIPSLIKAMLISTPSAMIYLQIDDHPERIAINLTGPAILGRSDVALVDIDLSPFNGADKGVSRRHALLDRDQDTVTLMDLDSVGGTFLNGQWLQHLERRVLRNGDEIRMGALTARVYFG